MIGTGTSGHFCWSGPQGFSPVIHGAYKEDFPFGGNVGAEELIYPGRGRPERRSLRHSSALTTAEEWGKVRQGVDYSQSMMLLSSSSALTTAVEGRRVHQVANSTVPPTPFPRLTISREGAQVRDVDAQGKTSSQPGECGPGTPGC